MVGESHLMEQAKKQWEKLDAEGHKIINNLLTADTERTAWPENMEPKFTRKKGAKMMKVAYETKANRYTYQEKTVPAGELIRLDIPNSYIYFSYHLMKKVYVVINAHNRLKPDTKYIVTAPYCHWIRERNITVLALLSYAVCNTHLTRGNVQKAIKESPTEETLVQRIAEQECYTDLMKIILTAITDLSEAEELSVSHKDKIDKINGMIKFMREKGVKPGCKTLTGETVFSDPITAGHDTGTMDSARGIINTKLPADEFIKQWKNQHDNKTRIRNKSKQRELLEKQWGEYLTPSRDRKDPETNLIISMGSNTTGTSTYQKEQQITDYEPNVSEITTVPRPTITQYGADVPKEVLDNIPTFGSKPGELNQFLSTIELYSTMYRIRKTDLVMLCSREKVHEIIHHALAEDADVEWSVIKRKLTSNYGSTRSGIKASVKILKLSMNSKETVGEYLTKVKTLVKSKIKDATSWHRDIDEADAYHMCNGLIKTGLKSRMLRRVSQFKMYKELFNNIEEEWERSYFMEDDFAGKEDTPTTTAEVDKINRAPFRGGQGNQRSFTP